MTALLIYPTLNWACKLLLALAATLEPERRQEQLDDFPCAFEKLGTEGISIPLRSRLDFDQRGGHLQGIQLYSEKGRNYVYLSGSSSEVAYMAKAELGAEAEVLDIDTLMLEPYRHAGGFQISGQYLAVGIEDNRLRTTSRVAVYDLEKGPDRWAEPLHIIARDGPFERVTAGAVGLTQVGDQMLLAVANWGCRNVDFYLCTKQAFKNGKGQFLLIDSLDLAQVPRQNWSDPEWHSYQNINLVTGSQNRVYMVGFARTGNGEHIADIFLLEAGFLGGSDTEIPASRAAESRSGENRAVITKLQSKVFSPSGNADFSAGAGLARLGGKLALLSCPGHTGDQSSISIFMPRE